MKNFAKTLLVALVAVIGVVLTSCNPEPEAKKFSLQFTGYGPGYVSVNVTVPSATTVAYMVSEEPLPELDAELLYVQTETYATFYTDGPQQLLDYPIEENTKYYVYLTAVLGDSFSQLYTYEFETEEFTFNQMATVVGVAPDGYKMYIQVPPSVKNSVPGTPGSRAIRYTQGDLMIYNFYKDSSDDTYSYKYHRCYLCRSCRSSGHPEYNGLHGCPEYLAHCSSPMVEPGYTSCIRLEPHLLQ